MPQPYDEEMSYDNVAAAIDKVERQVISQLVDEAVDQRATPEWREARLAGVDAGLSEDEAIRDADAQLGIHMPRGDQPRLRKLIAQLMLTAPYAHIFMRGRAAWEVYVYRAEMDNLTLLPVKASEVVEHINNRR